MAGRATILSIMMMGPIPPVLPLALHTQVLRACLLSGAACVTAWASFLSEVKDARAYFSEGGSELKALAPQLFASLHRNGVEIDPSFAPYLKVAYVREQARYTTYTRICRQALMALNAARVPFVVVSGLALSDAYYDPPFVRHNHDIDLVVMPRDVAKAADILVAVGYQRDESAQRSLDDLRCVHRSGLAVTLSARFVPLVGPDWLLAAAWRDARRTKIAGEPALTLLPAEALLIACGHSLWPRRPDPLVWAADACRLIRQSPQLDWNHFVANVQALAQCSEVQIVLAYLARELDASVPAAALDRLDSAAALKLPDDATSARLEPPAFAQGTFAAFLDTKVRFTADGNGDALTSYGWSQPELAHTWSVGMLAQLVLRIPPTRAQRGIVLVFEVRPLVTSNHPRLDVEVFANGVKVADWSYRQGTPLDEFRRLAIPGDVLRTQPLRIDFHIKNPASPIRLGTAPDTRDLGLCLSSLEIKASDSSAGRGQFDRELIGPLPGPRQELLFKAAFLSGDAAAQAWRSWRNREGLDPFNPAFWDILPLVHANRANAKIAEADLPTLKSAYFSVWNENVRRLHRLGKFLAELERAGVDTVLLKGAALFPDYQNDFGLRRMSDVDILVRRSQRDAAIAVLKTLGCIAFGNPSSATEWAAILSGHGWSFRSPHFDDADLRWKASPHFGDIDLHWHVLNASCQDDADDQFWADAEDFRLLNFSFKRLSATDRLLHVCVHGMQWQASGNVRWVSDAIRIIRSGGTGLDCARLVAQAKRHRAVPALRDALGYLVRTLDVAVPAGVMHDLNAIPVAATELIFHAVRSSGRKDRSLWAQFALRFEGALRHQPSIEAPSRWAALKQSVAPPRLRSLIETAAWWPLTWRGKATSQIGCLYLRLLRWRAGRAVVRPGEAVDFSAAGTGWRFMREGWSEPEEDGAWSVSPVARLVLSLRCSTARGLVLELDGMGYVHPFHPVVDVDVLAAGQAVGTFQFRHVEGGPRFETVTLPLPLLNEVRTDVELIFFIREPQAPQLYGYNNDVRELGIKLRRLCIADAES